MKRRLLSTARLAFPLAAAFAALLATPSLRAADGSWTGTSSGAWLTGTNWTGSLIPGSSTVTTNTDIATFNAALQPTIGINFNNPTLGVYSLGVIDNLNATARNIGNSSSTQAGILTLNGATVNGLANTIIRNNTTTLLTIQAQQEANAAMGLALGNAANNVIQINHSGGITISSNITGTARNLTLSSINHGSGVLTLSGTNSYTGNTRIDSGVLQFASQASHWW